MTERIWAGMGEGDEGGWWSEAVLTSMQLQSLFSKHNGPEKTLLCKGKRERVRERLQAAVLQRSERKSREVCPFKKKTTKNPTKTQKQKPAFGSQSFDDNTVKWKKNK